jgi:uncharacterized protein (DUF3084 family)
MDLLSFGLILLICLVGALVANLADNMGRRIGKSRRTIGKLRPRHTATLLTTITGFFLPLLTILTVAALSHDLRVILREGSRLISDNERAKKDLAQTSEQLAAKARELESQTAKTQTVTKEREKVSRELTQAKTEISQRQRTVGELRITTATLQRSAASLRTRLASLDRATKAARVRIAQEEKRNRELGARNQQLDVSYSRQRKEFADLDTERDRLVREVTDLQQNLQTVAQQLAQANADTKAAQENFDSMSRQLNERVELLSGRIREKEIELANLFDQAAAIASAPRTERLILSLNDELARGVIAAGSTIPEAKRLIQRLKRDADETARIRGATGAGFAPRDFNGRVITADQQENALLEDLINQSVDQVIVVTSIWNVYSRESVPIRTFRYPNVVVYTPGVVVLETRIRGDQSEVKILTEVTRWLDNIVVPKLAADGMLPSTGRTDRPELISGDELYALVREIRGANRGIRVQMLAKKVLRRADDPDFEFRIR